MAHVLFGDTDDWELDDADQDIRGWEVRDANGSTVGRVGGMAIDTDLQVVDTIILNDGSRFRAEDVTLSDGIVYVTTYGAPSGVSTRAYTDAHSVRRAGGAPVAGAASAEVEREHAEGRREIAEEQAEMRREMREPDRVEEVREGRREIEGERAEARREVAEASHDASGFAAFEDDFRSHYRNAFGDDDLDFADYSPAYRYGYDTAYDDRYADRSFADAEPDLREAYYRRFGYPMSDNIVWNRVKGAVRHAYERARAAVR